MIKLFVPLLSLLFLASIQSCSSTNENKMTDSESTNSTADSLNWIIDELMIKWTNNKQYTTDVIELMPEEDFDFIPADSMMTFKEQATHIVETLHWQLEKLEFTDLPDFNNDTKADLVASYNALFDYILAELESFKGNKLSDSFEMRFGETSKRRMLNLMDNHVAHHRGQLIVYLRLKGIKPPRYKGW